MLSYGGVNGLAQTIADAIAQQEQDRPAEQGQYSGGIVSLSDGDYTAVLAVDIPLADGDYVWAVRSTGGRAVIVGA